MKRAHFIDFETHRFAPHLMAPPIVCMSWKSEGDDSASLGLWPECAPVLERFLGEATRGESVVVAHNTAYDMACLLADGDPNLCALLWLAYANNGIECTRVREKLLDIHDGTLLQASKTYHPYSMSEICARKFGAKLDKDSSWRLRYGELAGIPIDQWPERAVTYPKDDSSWGLRAYLEQRRRAASIGYTMPTQHLDACASFALQLTGTWGVITDVPRARALRVDIDRQMAGLRERLIDADFLVPKNLTLGLFAEIKEEFKKSDSNIRAAVEATWPEGLGDVPRTDAGNIKKDKDTIDLCTHPALQALVKYNALEKTGSTYVEALMAGIIHCSYNELVSSMRTSCRAINIQNQPRMPGVRECFITRKGRVLLACDFDSQEMRFLAQAQLNIMGRSTLAAKYQEDVAFDPHQYFAASAGSPDKRQEFKIANFGIPGGMGVKGLMAFAKGYGQTWTPEFAGKIKKQYFEWWPEMNGFFSFVRNLVGPASCGNLTIPQSGAVMGAVGYCDTANRLFQTPASHASKAALFEVVRRCYDPSMRSPLLASRPWAFIHDEVIVESPEYAIDAVAPEMERVMVEAMQPWCPDVPCSASATAMRRWSKKAKHTKDARGRIVPWDEKKEAA